MSDEAPSEAKLERLRGEGVVPLSSFSNSCAALIAMIALAPTLLSWFIELRTQVQNFWNDPTTLLSAEKFATFRTLFLKLVITPAITVLIAIFIFGLLQSRFLFNTGLLSALAIRLNPFRSVSLWNFVGACLRAVALCTIGFICIATIVYFGLDSLSDLLLYDFGRYRIWPRLVYLQLAPYLLIGLAGVGLVSWLFSRLKFAVRYRMTGAEVEQQEREGI